MRLSPTIVFALKYLCIAFLARLFKNEVPYNTLFVAANVCFELVYFSSVCGSGTCT